MVGEVFQNNTNATSKSWLDAKQETKKKRKKEIKKTIL